MTLHATEANLALAWERHIAEDEDLYFEEPDRREPEDE